MTINSTIRKAGPFIGNGTASSFPFTYKVFKASDLDVVRLDQSTNVQTTLQRRAPHVALTLYPTPVQGDGAAASIARALGIAGRDGALAVSAAVHRGGEIASG